MRLAPLVAACLLTLTTPALAQPVALPGEVTLAASVEAYGAWNFARPDDGVTAWRAFDARHDSLTIQNAVLSATWAADGWRGRLAVQHGATGPAYYASEPVVPASRGVPGSGPTTWQALQEALVGYHAPLGAGLQIDAGLFLSPVGPEAVPVQDDWNWSRSNLFYALPYYHAGVRATQTLTPAWALQVALVNGWNRVVDDNTGKTTHAQLSYERADGALTAHLLYMGGVERPTGAPEGQPWRHLFDLHGIWTVHDGLAVGLHVDAGWERNHFGLSHWQAGALYARQRLAGRLWLALRADGLRETVASGASALFFPAPWVASGTATLDLRPVRTDGAVQASVRLEFRHDQGGAALYRRGGSASDRQDTLTLGLVVWF